MKYLVFNIKKWKDIFKFKNIEKKDSNHFPFSLYSNLILLFIWFIIGINDKISLYFIYLFIKESPPENLKKK